MRGPIGFSPRPVAEVFRYLLGPGGLADAFVAEHVWEHLSLSDAHVAARNCQRYLRPGGRLRIAVPDPAWYSSSVGSPSTSRSSHRDGLSPGGVQVPSSVGAESSTVPGFEEGVRGMVGSGSNGGRRDGVEGASGASSERGESHAKPRFEQRQGNSSGGPATGSHLDLPGWLSLEMLLADARDRHLVQFTPELLANVCWSAGLTPFLLEGGGPAEHHVVPGHEGTDGPAGTADAKNWNDEESDEGRGTTRDPRRREATSSLVSFPIASQYDVEEREQHHLWGHIKRSVAGGDPRGAVSIVMDCVKPLVGRDAGLDVVDFRSQSEFLGAGNVTDNMASRRPGEGNPENLNGHASLHSAPGGISPPKSPSASVHQKSPILGSSLGGTGTTLRPFEAEEAESNRAALAGAAAGITSGIGQDQRDGGSVAGGVVAFGKSTAAAAQAVANHPDNGSRSASTVMRPVARQEADTKSSYSNNVIGGQGSASAGGGGMRITVVTTGCRGLLCDGGGQRGDAAGSGEGG